MNLNWLKRSIWTGCLFFGGILVGTNLSRVAETPATVPLLQNTHVEVNRIEYPEKSVRSPHVRPRSQVIVFIDDAHYQVVYQNGKTETRERKAGDIIWHSQGEEAPTLTNLGAKYRTVVVNLK